ncbi:substrate-binding periplasmic protein [Pseudoalteromonas denitrificans]|uniref:ABC-type amino acid transport substrate-binding protein n=1 Tax=Pseudoalteromonas denitrificans DSM 6059 TaxID=1123010 RepID=A0A1I1J757_9GAMM|nr:transporter substrate-binding domain-containing protein [Pseudoalteromonas denitrificans]SFC41783.1 ABC-type amino acid transport substrate-binding protein [Pseudoalteromonas denitrificans DSM 6059]
MKVINLQFILSSILLLFASNFVMAQRTSIALGTEDWPPFSYEDKVNNKTSGLSTEIINATFKRMGISIEENNVYPWARAQQNLYTGELDAIYTASINDERLKYSYFPSEPIITSKWVLFIRKSEKDTLSFKGLTDLKQKSIGLIRGYNYPSKFKEYISDNAFILESALETTNIAMLIKGRFNYMPAVLETTLYFAKNTPELKKMDTFNNLYYFPTPLATTDFYLMFSKKTVKKAFVEKFSKTLIAFKKTDEYQKLLVKYF